MIPQKTEYEFEEESSQPSHTYRIDFGSGRAAGYIDGIEAVKQAIVLILNTDRYRHLIFSWSYGSELKTVIGMETALAESEAKRIITEALMQDDRITSVDDFSFARHSRNTVTAEFTVTTIYGGLEFSTEVEM